MNRTLNIKKIITQFFFDLGHFYEGGDFLDEGARNTLSPDKSISHLAEIESPVGGNISAGW